MLAERFDEKPAALERAEVIDHRTMLAVKRHLEPITFDVIDSAPRVEIGAFDDEGAVGLFVHEAPCRVQWMDDGEAQSSAGDQYPRRFGDGARHVVDVLQRHEVDDEICA